MSTNNQKDHWNLKMALKVLESETVDSKLWSEAVEWLLLFGPPEIKEMILQSSGMATRECFPSLNAQGFTDDGQPYYTIKDLADALNVTEEAILEKMADKEDQQGVRCLVDETETRKLQ